MDSRPDDSFGSHAERDVVRSYAAMAATITTVRRERGWSLRRLAAEVAACVAPASYGGVGIAKPLSVITSVEAGNSWPRFDSLALTAQALGHRVQIAHPAPREQPLAVPEERMPGLLDLLWQSVIILELEGLVDTTGTSRTELAARVGLRKNTVTELYGLLPVVRAERTRWAPHRAQRTWTNVRTLLALSQSFGTYLEVVPRSQPWPLPPNLAGRG